eukprot:CAMPEP_0168609950 /NCGR_PEP_ID=MMETSP0449_2-20121227/1502_1 /TAXON_ID=1082188 /ORGANISM="Strombidium rassoulzadegani, Strain ras09" /LENGTH=122 /DNA_ID=CAMNT_0008650173 /DNA_START=114 /DNA_END=482 /DNA_ORIENTATION=-
MVALHRNYAHLPPFFNGSDTNAWMNRGKSKGVISFQQPMKPQTKSDEVLQGKYEENVSKFLKKIGYLEKYEFSDLTLPKKEDTAGVKPAGVKAPPKDGNHLFYTFVNEPYRGKSFAQWKADK